MHTLALLLLRHLFDPKKNTFSPYNIGSKYIKSIYSIIDFDTISLLRWIGPTRWITLRTRFSTNNI
jgi:hypothetical protein